MPIDAEAPADAAANTPNGEPAGQAEGSHDAPDYKARFEDAKRSRDAAKSKLRDLESKVAEYETSRKSTLAEQGNYKQLHDELTERLAELAPLAEEGRRQRKYFQGKVEALAQSLPDGMGDDILGSSMDAIEKLALLEKIQNKITTGVPRVPAVQPGVTSPRKDLLEIQDKAERKEAIKAMSMEEKQSWVETLLRKTMSA